MIIALSKPEMACVAASGMVRFFDEYITIKLLMVDTLTIAHQK
jgi:preprotein translocase subunit Sec61beta